MKMSKICIMDTTWLIIDVYKRQIHKIMHIDFASPSNGTYNNAGSCRQLANYMEHEDLERIEKGIYTEGYFNLTDDNIYKSKVIRDIDSNIGQLLKTDAKFYAIHVSPSEKELRAMGNTCLLYTSRCV